MKNKLMFIGLTICAAVNASEGAKAMNAAQDFVNPAVEVAQIAPSRYAQFMTSTKSALSKAGSSVSNATSSTVTYLGETRPVKFVAPYAIAAGTKVAKTASSVKANTWDKNLGYFKHDGKVATSAAVVAIAGLTYATYKAYQNGFFSKLNPFGKVAVVEEVKVEAPVVKAPVVQAKRQFNKPVRWNAKTRTYEVAQ